ncbi:hypothetical protein Q5H92_13710 [Hymenobacter sp. M29]|uniref:Uncharacterized protein n=1 Tax=Hymenobacter mellowenesis TaxID=3063995 RepID=A0ABT9AC46_9BACT|nr:hypothetical protein [Hymenobacter sp. M29]MDO7847421.1 hypothetical protein [Hymenobacter sp. M29]
MKFLFRVRFLLGMIALLLLVLYLQRAAGTRVSNRLGGPVEIAYAQGYARHVLWLGLRFFVAGVGVPVAIGLAVYGCLRWRHRGTPRGPLGRPLLLATLAAWAWGLLGVVAYAVVPAGWKPFYAPGAFLLEAGMAIAAARAGYYDRRPTSPPVAGITLSGGHRQAGR